MEFLTAWGLQAHSEKDEKKSKTQKQRHRNSTVWNFRILNATGVLQYVLRNMAHIGFRTMENTAPADRRAFSPQT